MSWLSDQKMKLRFRIARGSFIKNDFFRAERRFRVIFESTDEESLRAVCASYLGRCCLATGQHEPARQYLGQAYAVMFRKGQRFSGVTEEFFIDTVIAYADALRRAGQLTRAEDLMQEFKKYCRQRTVA